MSARIRTLDFLPEIFKTKTNAQFLSATLDQLVSQPESKKIQGYIGSKVGYGINAKDYYVTEPTKTRTDYQLEPGVVFKKANQNTAKDFISYPGILDSLSVEGGIVNNNSRLFNSEFYSWDSFTNLDKLINYNQYYWLPEGPESVTVTNDVVFTTEEYNVTSNTQTYTITNVDSSQGETNPTLIFLRGGTYTFYINQSSSFWIQGEPGLTGFSPSQPNMQTRDVLGVENNGISQGIITFTVPQKDAQSQYDLPGNNLVDVVSNIPFNDLNGALVSDLVNGIDNVTALNGLTVMFYDTGIPSEVGYIGATPTIVNDNFYKISYVGDLSNPTISLSVYSPIPISQKITAVYGLDYISKDFYKNTSGYIEIIPYLSSQLDTLYYQDGTTKSKVGKIQIIESNATNLLDIGADILGKAQYTATNGVVFSNGLKVRFQGIVSPNSYLSGEYYVEGVGTAIELLPTTDFTTPEQYTTTSYIAWDITPWDSAAWEGNSNVPTVHDYITIARNSIDKNAWARSNRWFHIDIINNTALYNNNPDLISLYATYENKAKRPIIEFYSNLKLFDNGTQGKVAIDFMDSRTTDAFSYVAGQQNYYPDIEVYTSYTGSISTVNYVVNRVISSGSNTTGIFQLDSGYDTTGFRINDLIVFDNVTPASGVTAGAPYYIAEIVSSTEFKISLFKDGDVLIPSLLITGPYSFEWTPQSTTITIDATDVFGNLTVGQYITDSTNILPRNSQVLSISGTSTLTVLVGWDITTNYFNGVTDSSSFVASDSTVDNYALFDGARIVFSADENVKDKIYTVRISKIDESSVPLLTLYEAEDGDVLVNQQMVVQRGFNYAGVNFWYDGIEWINGQQKTDVNQPPLFDILDENNISFGNPDVYYGTSFLGNKLFSYGIGTGIDDSILGFPIRYSSVDNIGDISFDVAINTDTFDYVQGTTPVTQPVNTGYVFQYVNRTSYIRQLGWQTAVSPSVQYQVFSFNYDPLVSTNVFVCDIPKVDNDYTNWPTIKVLNNNEILSNTEYTVSVDSVSTTVTLNVAPSIETIIQVLILSESVSNTAYYETPTNLNKNPLNESLTVADIGDIRRQYQSMFFNNPDASGTVFGSNNFRDLGNMVPWGDSIIKNSAAFPLVGAFLRKSNYNLFNALQFNSKEYIKFKSLLAYTIENTDFDRRYTAAQMLDDALDQITSTKTENQSFFWSDMLPSKAPYVTNSYSFPNSLAVSVYPLTKVYDFSKSNYDGVLVYLSRIVNNLSVVTQLTKDIDYTISTDSPSLTVTKSLLPNDIIIINEYNQTYGSYIPNTPTKLGLYPSFKPEIILDSNYNKPTYFIRGHDGSYTKLYGEYDSNSEQLEDFRDKVLLEFELRIFNNLKISARIPISEYELIPGYFRNTDYSYEEWLSIYSSQFLNWVGQNRLDYKRQYYNVSDSFSYNYSQSGNAIDKSVISQGYWRGIYQYYFDTTTPDTTPWEMLGFTAMPSWWITRYGPAPYTSDNLVLWNDLEEGFIWNNGDSYINPLFSRPNLSKIIPVNGEGSLLPPIDAVVGSYNTKLFQKDWKIGDDGPVELSYRRSSSFPYDLIRILALTKPAKFFNLGVNLDDYQYNEEFNQYLVNDRSNIKLSDIKIYGNGTSATSFINWIVDYQKQVGTDSTAELTEYLSNIDVRLIYRLAGFSDKTQLKFFVEKGSPNSNNASLLIPDESIGLLLYDNQPFKRLTYSSVVIQKTDDGYSVYGNSQNSAYFRTLKPKFSGQYDNIKVEDITVKITNEHFDIEQLIPYNTIFYTVQEIAQFLSDYGAYLEKLGMVFTEQEQEITVNWNQMIAEFLYWSQQGWSTGSIVSINPSAKSLTIDKDSNIVQPLTIQQQNFVLNQNLYPIQVKDLCVDRQGTRFSIEALNDGDMISYGQFNLSNFEHAIVFDNRTLFGDVIYNLVTGLRQQRILLKGIKSAAWDGTINAFGFIYNQDNIENWNSSRVYTKGEIVTYKNKYWIAIKVIQPSQEFNESEWKKTDYDEIQKGLLPNASTSSYESTLYYDVNQANLEKDADLLGFSLIGYRPRDYMSLADLSDITQVNVYKNLIKDKGTLNSASAFKGAQLPQGGIEYYIYENWAIKSGEFGGVLNDNFIEFKVNQKYMTGNPSIVGLTDGIQVSGVQQEIPLYSLFNYGRPITSANVLPTINSDDINILYPDAGYVNYNDVKMSAFYYSQLPGAVNKNGSIVPIQQFYVRDYVWLANFLENWQAFTPTSMGQVVYIFNNLNNTITVTFNNTHNLSENDPFAVVNFDTRIDDYYIVATVVDPYRVIVSKILDPNVKSLYGQGIGLKFQSQRVSTPSDINNLPLIDSEFRKNTVWVDRDSSGGWGVYRKSINYVLENQIIKTGSESLGSAVAVGETLGYLISDAVDGKVYRYTYNDLANEYQLVQTITGNVGFGSTISYSGNIYAIAQPTGVGRSVKLYQLQNTPVSDDIILIQTLTFPTGATTWGTSIAISGDQNWIYISDIDNNIVHVYLRSATPTTAGYFVIGDTYIITSLGDTDFTDVGSTSNVIGTIFIATGIGTGTGTATNYTYRNVTSIDGDSLGLTTSGDNFGYSISTDHDGDCVIIGTPNKDNGSMSDWGYAYVFDRVEQNIEIQTSFVPMTYPLIWTPTSLSASVTDTNSVGNVITITVALDAVEDLNKPVMFSGSGFVNTAIVTDRIYYISSISGYDITIKETRESTTDVSISTVSSMSNATAYVQTEQLNVFKNGVLLTDDNYAAANNTLVYVGNNATPGDILTVSGYEIIRTQTLTTAAAPQIGAQFGISVDTNTHASELLIGAPFQLNSQLQEGVVYRYTDAGAKFGIVTGTTDCVVTTTRRILINGFMVTINAGNAQSVAQDIVNAKVTNITASSIDGKLIIALIDNALAPVNEKLFLNFDSTTTIQELGLVIYSNTQTITCPHNYGPTQFGTVVKFNQYDSFVASAPTGTRYSGTTFDFIDDENQDNDTIFDNNATCWVDTSENFGAVYMFDFVSEYDLNIDNPGKFIYAQSVNSPNLVYTPFNSYNQDTDITSSNQPRYGTAIDFNGYSVIVGTPNDIGATTGTTYAGSATIYHNSTNIKDWSIHRQTSEIVDIEKIFNVQLFDTETNTTLITLDYIDPLRGKILGIARENIDYVSNADPAYYNNTANLPRGSVWAAEHLGQIWLNTKNMRYVNYHQNNDVSYNSQYWATLFPGSIVEVYSWVSSKVLPVDYQGPGTPYDINQYSIQLILDSSDALVPIYYFWARNTDTIFANNGKTLSDTVIASYILSPKSSGIGYFTPLTSSMYGLYNCGEYFNANSTALHIGFKTGNADTIAHSEFNLIRDGNPDDFLPGVPVSIDLPTENLYNKLIDSLSGVTLSGAVVPDPYLPKAVQTGILARPYQSFFYNRFNALQNYLTYANSVMAKYPIVEIRPEFSFLNRSGEFFDTSDYWEYVNWWKLGYNDTTKAAFQVSFYATLSSLNVNVGTIVSVASNNNGNQETYIYEGDGVWDRIGLMNGTIRFKSSLWDYPSVRLGYGDNFFDTDLYDSYPSEETRNIIRALNEQVYTDDLLIYRNQSLILLFKYIQSESSENQNYLPWLNKTSFIDVLHTIRELKPIEVYQQDNQEFLLGYINEIKPYHVLIKEFLFKYTKIEVFEGNVTDFDLPAQYNAGLGRFVSPELVYDHPNDNGEYGVDDPIWDNPEYSQWKENYGVGLTGILDVKMTTLSSYISLNSNEFFVDNAQGFPVTGVIKIDNELIAYSNVDRAYNLISELTRGVNGTAITAHIPNTQIYMDLPPVIVLDSGRLYREPPKVMAYIDTSIYPIPTRPAQLEAVMGLDSVISINVIDSGEGYAVLPEIRIEPAVTITFSNNDVNLLSSTVELFAPLLSTGDLIQYKVGANSTNIDGLKDSQWYYINVLESNPSVIIGFYSRYSDAIKNHNRLTLYSVGTGTNHYINLGAKASAISTSIPIRQNNIGIKFDRTSYTSKLLDWRTGRYYGSFYAGELNNRESVASSSITLYESLPPVSEILASAQGISFEIGDVRNDRVVTYSSFVRIVELTLASNDAIRLTLQDYGTGNPNASGGTNGFYIGMPIKFDGAIGTSGLLEDQVYYVNSILTQTDFTVSLDPSGSPVVSLNDWTVVLPGLNCHVGQVSDTAVITVNYPGIRNVSSTQAISNKLTIPMNTTGTGGTDGFYIDIPIFFTGTANTLPQNGVFGGITENDVYYVTTIIDEETFTMSKTRNPQMFTVVSTTTGSNIITIDTEEGTTSLLSINEPIIFNNMVNAGVQVTNFGGLVSGTVYYVSEIVTTSTFKVSELINGGTLSLTTVAASASTSVLLTSQKDVAQLTSVTADTMVVNVNLPVSPGQVDGQLFTFYETSETFIDIEGDNTSLLTRGVAALIGNRTVPATEIVIGQVYTILTVGTTDFTLVGAASNTIGVSFTATGVGSGTGTTTLAVNIVAMDNYNPGDLVAQELNGIYNNLPLEVTTTLGASFLQAATQYYVVDSGTIEITVTATTASGNVITCDTTSRLFIDMPIVFSGSGTGGVEIDTEYWVKRIIDNQHFVLATSPGGNDLVVVTASGLMTGIGLPYIKLSTSIGGSSIDPGDTQQTATITIASPAVITVMEAPATGTRVLFRTTGSLPGGMSANTEYYVQNLSSTTFNIRASLTGSLINTSGTQSGTHTMIVTEECRWDQTPIVTPIFNVSYMIGGYQVLVNDPGEGYTVDNIITIPGDLIGGATPINDLTLTVTTVSTIGEITGFTRNGTPAGNTNNYYVKVISPTEMALYQDALLTVPVSGLSLLYTGIIETTVTNLNSGTEQLTLSDISGFVVNDLVIFTGDLTPAVGALVQGDNYYITSISGNDITVSTIPGGTNINIITTIAASFTVAKFGSFALLPEPFTFNQSLVKYNNRVYVCIISNNDDEFVFGKWELLSSGDSRLNAIDRVNGYYTPTENMPGIDLSQLFDGVTYPYSTYYGNPFEPALQHTVDTVLKDQEFYPTEIDIASVVWNGTYYFAVTDAPTYSSVVSSNNGIDWNITKLANTPLGVTDIIYAGGYYLITTNNSATPIFRSDDGVTWTTNGYYTPWGSGGFDAEQWDSSALVVSSLFLNAIAYSNGIFVSVGDNIIYSNDTYVWTQGVDININPSLVNILFGVEGIDITTFNGFVAVGKGQIFEYSSGITQTMNTSLIYFSTNGINWQYVNPVSTLALYAIAGDGSKIITVGEDGVIYTSTNGSNWLGVNETNILSVNQPLNALIVTSTVGFVLNEEVKFNKDFNVFTAGVSYYVKSIPVSNQITLSSTPGGATIVPSSDNPPPYTYLFKPRTESLRDVHYANGVYVAVGDLGLIRTSIDGYAWTTRTSGTTENLKGINYTFATIPSGRFVIGISYTILTLGTTDFTTIGAASNIIGVTFIATGVGVGTGTATTTENVWITVGENNTILTSVDNGVSWSSSSLFSQETSLYTIQGSEFEFGYGPEELVPGVVTDNVTMTVITKPGTNWEATIYQHVGYNVVSIEITPSNGTQTVYSFDVGNVYSIQSPVKIAVFQISGTTGLSTSLYQTSYTTDWVNNTITLNSALPYSPVKDKLRIDVYEAGNGNQIVKSSTKTDPIRTNDTTGWNEIYTGANYTGEVYAGSGVVRPVSYPVDVLATETESSSNSITCEDVKNFILNDPIRFQGTTFGGIVEDATYYVKTISYVTNRITISDTVTGGVAGPTYTLSDGTGSMNAIIKIGYGATWSTPLIYHNGTKLLVGTTSTVTKTKFGTNTITTNTTSGMILNEPIMFSNTIFGGVLLPQTTYYIKTIVDDNEFTVSATPGGAVIALTDATGGAEFITNDYAFGITPNGINAKIIFAKDDYDASVDYIVYTLFGESSPGQYEYTIPETQIITGNNTTGPFTLTNFVGDYNPTNAIVEVNGLRLTSSQYTINSSLNQITFTSAPATNAVIAVTTYNSTDRQYFNTQYNITGKTVSTIATIDNAISPYTAILNVTNTTTGTNYITCYSTTGLIAGQTVIFKGASALGGIQVNGTVYYVKQVISGTQFTISATSGGSTFALSTAAGTLVGYAGGLPAVRITTSGSHNLTTNNIVRIDGVQGSVQLNNSTYYVHVINTTQFDLYSTAYDAALNAINFPITDISSYISGGYAWVYDSFQLITTTVTQTTTDPVAGNYLTVADTSMLEVGTPILFTGTSLGGVALNSEYYIREVISGTTFSITETRDGDEFVLTNAVGSMYATQWSQDNVDRLWVTVNGYRVPSSALRINNGTQLSILIAIQTSDTVIITSMMPSATPNEEIYLLNVNKNQENAVYRANTQTRTWLTQALLYESPTIYVSDVTRITDVVIQNEIVPSAVNGYYYIGITADKRTITDVKVYNNTTGQYISSDDYQIVLQSIAPVLKITPSASISVSDSLTITILQGNLIYINGEQIKFTEVDLINNTISGLIRGANGTGQQHYIPVYTEVFGLLSNNEMATADYYETWNSSVYNTTTGDPLQISTTSPAIFLRGDIN